MNVEIFINLLFNIMKSYEEERSDFWRTAGLVLIGLFLGYIIGRFELTTITFENNNEDIAPKDNVESIQDANASPADEPVVISENDDPYVGSEEAPVIIIDFSDYQCPFCAKFYSEMFPQLEVDYINTGKVKYVFRDFPLNIHPKAQYAHYAAECGKEQNKYWEMHGILFEKQSEWSKSEDIIETFISYADESGLNVASFKECLTSERYRDEVAKDKEDGISYGVKGTPTLIINGKIIRGISTYDQLKQVIEKEL